MKFLKNVSNSKLNLRYIIYQDRLKLEKTIYKNYEILKSINYKLLS